MGQQRQAALITDTTMAATATVLCLPRDSRSHDILIKVGPGPIAA